MDAYIDDETLAAQAIAGFIRTENWRRYSRRVPIERVNLWETGWGRMITDDNITDPTTKVARLFRRRFRVPYLMFRDVIVPMSLERRVFGPYHSAIIPVEFKILVSLRVLGRGNCYDDIYEMSSVPERTVGYIFSKFVINFADAFFDELVYFPKDDELKRVVKEYARMGMPNACGSMDVVHIFLNKCRECLRNLCTGIAITTDLVILEIVLLLILQLNNYLL